MFAKNIYYAMDLKTEKNIKRDLIQTAFEINFNPPANLATKFKNFY